MAQSRALVRSYLGRYYADELRSGALQLDSLLVPQSAAMRLQGAFLARREGVSGAEGDGTAGTGQITLYETEHEMWHPIFERLVERFGWQDILFAVVDDGRVLYSVSKTPVFQTNLVEGPYAESGLGALFRELRRGQRGAARLTDPAPFIPAHGLPVSFSGVPIFDEGARIGVLLVQEDPGHIDGILSANGHWSTLGLGATGDLFVVGADGRMRSRSRYFEQLRATSPEVEREGLPVSAFGPNSILDPGDVRVAPLRYVNHRRVPVFGAAKRVEIAELPWTVIAEIEEADALAPLGPLRESLGLLVLGLLLLGGIVILVVTTWMLRPLAHILDTLRAVRRGDSAARAPARTPAELGALSAALNDLIASHADWVDQESAERQEREAEIQELVSVVNALARGDLARHARVDGHLAVLANAINAMGSSVGHLTDRLVLPPRVAETAHAMQALADQIVLDTDREKGELETASTAASEMLDWLRGCVVDSHGVVDAASRVESIGRRLQHTSSDRDADAAESENQLSPDDESRDKARSGDDVGEIAARYGRLRATVDEGDRLQVAIRNAVDGARRIRTGAEALHGHAQTLQILALDLHAQGGVGGASGPNGAHPSGAEEIPEPEQSASPRV